MDTIELFRTATMAVRVNKTRSFLTALGIIIGVASVILLVSIGNGLQAYITEQFKQLGSNVLFVVPGKVNLGGGGGGGGGARSAFAGGFTSKFTFEDVQNIGRLGDPISAASSAVTKSITVKYRNKTYDATLDGVDENIKQVMNLELTSGTMINRPMVERSQAVAVIGPKVVENLFAAGEDPLGREIDISGRKFKVIGVTVSKGGGFGGGGDQDSIVFVPLTAAAKLIGAKNPAEIFVIATSPDAMSQAATKVKNYLYRKKLTNDDFTVLEPTQILSTINSVLGTITGALSGIAAISLVVGGIGIANIMLVSVTERTREIGLRKAVGATYRDILTQFLLEAILLSVLGGMIGILLGGGLAWLLSRFISTAVTPGSVVLAFGISCLVGVTAGIAPAMRAAKLDPITALRWE